MLAVFAICHTAGGLLLQCFSELIQSRSIVFGKGLLFCILVLFIRKSYQLANFSDVTSDQHSFKMCEGIFVILALICMIPMFVTSFSKALFFCDLRVYQFKFMPRFAIKWSQMNEDMVRNVERVFDRIFPGELVINESIIIPNRLLFSIGYHLSLVNIFVLCIYLIGMAATSASSKHRWSGLQLFYPMIWLLFSVCFKNECIQYIEMHIFVPELKALKAEQVKRLSGSFGLLQLFLPLLFALCVIVFGYTIEYAAHAGIACLVIEMFVSLPLLLLALWR